MGEAKRRQLWEQKLEDHRIKRRRLECVYCKGDHWSNECPEHRNIRRCYNCVFMANVAYGYSNYTVEGHSAHCTANKNPTWDDAPYLDGADAKEWEWSKRALTCEMFTHGEPMDIDVDRENITDCKRFDAFEEAAKQGDSALLAVALGLMGKSEEEVTQ